MKIIKKDQLKIVLGIAILGLSVIALFFPEIAFAEAKKTTQLGTITSVSEAVETFFALPLTKGIIQAGSIFGGIYMVLKGFGIVGDQTNFKQLILGIFLTAIGLAYSSITTKIVALFSEGSTN